MHRNSRPAWMVKLIAGLFPIAIVSGCATVDLASLENSGLVGSWKSENFGAMSIYCSGAFSYESNSAYIRTESNGNWIKKITNDGFIVGPIGMKYFISKWPYAKNGVTQMTVDKRRWVLIEKYHCQ